MEKDCIFCQILNGKLPVSMVYQDEICSVFMDINPVTPGHLLVIPNRHAVGLSDLPQKDGEHIFAVGQKIANRIKKSSLRCEGINLFLADGVAAGQEVFHVHLHVFPRFEGDGFGLKFSPDYGKLVQRQELDRIAEELKNL